jgi:hypothetical protein
MNREAKFGLPESQAKLNLARDEERRDVTRTPQPAGLLTADEKNCPPE